MTEGQDNLQLLKIQIPVTSQYQFFPPPKDQSNSESPVTQISKKQKKDKAKSSFWRRVEEADSVQPFHQSWLHRVHQEAKIEFMNKLKQQSKGKFNFFLSIPSIITDQNFLQRRKTFETYIKDAYLELLYLQLKKAKGVHSQINQKASYKQVLSQTQNNKLQSQFFMRFKKNRGIIYSNELWSGKYYNRIIEQSRLKKLSDILHSQKSKAGTQEELLYQFEQYFNRKQNIQKIKGIEDLVEGITEAFGLKKLFPQQEEKKEIIQKQGEKEIEKNKEEKEVIDSDQMTNSNQESKKSLFKLKSFLKGSHQSTKSVFSKMTDEKDSETMKQQVQKQTLESTHINSSSLFNKCPINSNEKELRPLTSPLQQLNPEKIHLNGKYTSQKKHRMTFSVPQIETNASCSQNGENTNQTSVGFIKTSQDKFQTFIKNSKLVTTENQQLIKQYNFLHYFSFNRQIETFQKQEEIDNQKEKIFRKKQFRINSIQKMLVSNKELISNSHIRKRIQNQQKNRNKNNSNSIVQTFQ